MPRKKTSDPKIIKLLDELATERDTWERCYDQLRRVCNRLEKSRRRVVRLETRLRKLDDQATT